MFTAIIYSIGALQTQISLEPINHLVAPLGFTSAKSFKSKASKYTTESYGYSWQNNAKGIQLNIRVSPLKEDAALEPAWKSYLSTFARQPNVDSKAPSGMPLGQHLFFSTGPTNNSTTVRVMCKELSLHITSQKSVRNSSLGLGSEEPRFFESIARWIVATEAGKLMSETQEATGGLKLRGLRTRSNVALGNVREFAQKRNLPFNLNERDGLATLTIGTSNIIIPLGSSKIKIRDTWVELPHIVVCVKKDPYVPLAQLAQL